jgi:hypothetical protein
LMHSLPKAVPQWADLVLVEDVDRLPFGPGILLRDLMRSHRAAVCKKTARRSVV